MATLSIKIPPTLDDALESASRRTRLTKSELARRAIAAYLAQAEGDAPELAPSALQRAGDLVGCLQGGPSDLSHNPRYLDDLGA